MRKINKIIIHCSATPEGRDNSAADIRRWHLAQKYKDIAYHYVIRLDGTIEKGRDESVVGAHTRGHNATSIGVCYVGGVARDGRTPKDTRTAAQKSALVRLTHELRQRYPLATVHGHREFASKACPSFDVQAEF